MNNQIYIVLVSIIIIFIIFYLLNNNFYIKSNEHFSNQTIPKIIIQTWKSNDIPDKYKDYIASVKRYNPDFKYLFFTDDDIDKFIKLEYPNYYDTYLKLPVKIQKIDYFRYIAVYHYGGFYFDLDMNSTYPLDDLLNYDCIFPVDQNLQIYKKDKSRYKYYFEKNMNFMLGQYAFGAKPKDKFIKLLIDIINNNIDKYIDIYKDHGDTLQYVYSSTGPDFVTDVYIEYKNKNDIHILHYPEAQYFGKYAKHNYIGTWK